MVGQFEVVIEPDGMLSMSADDFLALTVMAAEGRKGSRLGPAAPDAEVLSPQQAADFLGYSRATIDRMVADRSLPFVLARKGKRKKLISFKREDLARWKGLKK